MRLTLCLLAFWFALVASPALAEEAAQRKLTTYLAELNSLEAGFEQQLQNSRGQRLQASEGEMRLLNPGRFYWETHQPFPEVLVSDGETLWLYDPDLEQVTVQALDQRLAATPALILSGDASDLTEHFSVSLQQVGHLDIFTLRPKAQDSLFEAMSLHFSEGQLQSLRLEDSLGQQTRVDLINPRFNQPLDIQAFEFVIPEGVDVIRE